MAAFRFKKRVYYHDTDCEGVVYYANYLKYLEETRTEQFRSHGIDLKTLAGKGFLFAVTEVRIRYKSPARYNDELDISSEIVKSGKVFLDFLHSVRRGDITLVECETRLVCLGRDFKPVSIPDDITRSLSGESAGNRP